MNIHLADIPHLPLIAALLGHTGKQLAATPEWRGQADEALSYPIRDQRLVVNPMIAQPGNPAVQAAMDRLIAELEGASRSESDPPTQARLRMLAISLRAVIGRTCTTEGGTVANLVACIGAGADARIGGLPNFDVRCSDTDACSAPEALALLLVQMIVNAHVHAGLPVTDISVVIHSGRRFGVVWPGRPPMSSIKTSRLDNPEDGWGLSFAQTIADTLGGRVYPPRADGPGLVRTACELDVNRVVIPLAQIGVNQTIMEASPTWTEETGWRVRDAVTGPVWSALIAAAQENPGQIIFQDGRSARFTPQTSHLWLGIPPVNLSARIDAALHGVDHEAQLWQAVAPQSAYRIRALSKIVRWLRTGQIPTNNRSYWLSNWPPAIKALTDQPLQPPGISEVAVLDATVCAYIYATYGAALESQGTNVWIHARPDAATDPIWQALAEGQDRLPLGIAQNQSPANQDRQDDYPATVPDATPATRGLPLSDL